jgi:hypothetical protein
MTQAYDSARLAGVYHAGNEMPQASLDAWTDLIKTYSPVPHLVAVDLSAAEFAAGLERMARAAQAQSGDVPVLERYDVIVFAR